MNEIILSKIIAINDSPTHRNRESNAMFVCVDPICSVIIFCIFLTITRHLERQCQENIDSLDTAFFFFLSDIGLTKKSMYCNSSNDSSRFARHFHTITSF